MAKRKGKKRKRRVLVFLSMLVFAAIGITIAYAANNLGNTATNVVTVGNVKIALYNQDDDDVNSHTKKVMPGDQISKVVKVENVGGYNAYIRMKVKKEWLNNDSDPEFQFKAEAIEPIVEKGWSIGTAEDSDYVYYYYNTIVTPGAVIPFMNSFCVSAGAINQDNLDKNPNAEGKITVEAEAVQSDYYTPEGTKAPDGIYYVTNWKDVTFGDYVEDTPNLSVVTQAAVVNESSVEFVGNSGDFVSFKTGTDLFLNVKGLMPNETRSQIINIQNTHDSPVEVYLYAKVPVEYQGIARTNTEWKLLNALELTITSSKDNKVIYSGVLFEENSSKDMLSQGKAICLGNFQLGEKCQLELSVTLPKTWSHSYCQTKVDWVFMTKTTPPTQAPVRTFPPSVVTPTPIPTVEPEQTVPPGDIPIDADPPTEPPTPEPTPELTDPPIPTPEPTSEPTPTLTPTDISSPTILPTPTDLELGIDDNPMANTSAKPKPSKTPKPERTQKPKKTKKPAAPPTKNPEEEIGDNIPRIDVAPKLPEESATKTGDDTPIFFWCVVCFISLMGVLYNGIVLGKRKDKKE